MAINLKGFGSAFATGYKIGTAAQDRKKEEEIDLKIKEIMGADLASSNNADSPMAAGTKPMPEGGANAMPVAKEDPANMTEGEVGLPSKTPVADGLSKVAVAPEPKQMPSSEDLSSRYQKLLELAISNPKYAAKAESSLKNLKALGMMQHANSFDGDYSTPEGAIDYAKHMARGTAQFGTPMSADQAIRLSEITKTFQDENYEEALTELNRGNMKAAQDAFNKSGKYKGELANIRPAKFSLGGRDFNTYEADFTDSDGNTQTVNAMGMMFQGKALEDQVKFTLDATKVAQTDKQIAQDDKKIALQDRQVAVSEEEAKGKNKEVIQGVSDTFLINKNDNTAKKLEGVGGKPMSGSGDGANKMAFYGYTNQKDVENQTRAAVAKIYGKGDFNALDENERLEVAEMTAEIQKQYKAGYGTEKHRDLDTVAADVYKQRKQGSEYAKQVEEESLTEAEKIDSMNGSNSEWTDRGYKNKDDFIARRTAEMKSYSPEERKILSSQRAQTAFEQARSKASNKGKSDEEIRKAILERLNKG